jgi:putative globular PEP-CTERM protein (TIGR04254 family)
MSANNKPANNKHNTMKTHIIGTVAAIALGMAILAPAASGAPVMFNFTNDDFYQGSGNLFLLEGGKPMSGADNYVVGVWYLKKNTTDNWIFAGGAEFSDTQNNDPTLAGLVESTPGNGIGTPASVGAYWIPEDYELGDTMTFMIRAWNYGSEVSRKTVTDNQQLIDSFNSLITGSRYIESVFDFEFTREGWPENVGQKFPSTYSYLTAGLVPEFSAWAAIAGLATIVCVSIHRLRRR